MARTNNLTDFLTDVADAIKNKKGDNTPILASEFDTEITNLPSGSSSVVLDGTMKFQGSTFSTLPEWLANANGWDNYTNMSDMFMNCMSLTTIPLFDTSNVTTMDDMFRSCRSLTNESLDNILQMCINASLYKKKKDLYSMGLISNYYPATTIQSLPHYQDFLDAGWTIGY